MAIDFMVMPFTRYIAGDYVTPSMQIAWDAGVPYQLVTPEGPRVCPPDTPFGGHEAPAHRTRILAAVVDDVRALSPVIAANLWNEASIEAPVFHRPDTHSFGALLEWAKSPPRASWLSFGTPPPSHVLATVYVPVHFVTAPFEAESPLRGVVASAPRALEQLADAKVPEAAKHARDTLIEALSDAVRLRFPLIVDW